MKEHRLIFKNPSSGPEKSGGFFENPNDLREIALRRILGDEYAKNADSNEELASDIEAANKSLKELSKKMKDSDPRLAGAADLLITKIREMEEIVGRLSDVRDPSDSDLIKLIDLVMVANVLEDYATLVVKMDNYMVPDAVIAMGALENFEVDLSAIEVEESRIDAWEKQANRIERVFAGVDFDILPGLNLKNDTSSNIQYFRKSLDALKKSGAYLDVRKAFVEEAQKIDDFSPKELIKWCKKLRKTLPAGNFILAEDYKEFELSVRQDLVQTAIKKVGPEFEKSLTALSKYYTRKEVDGVDILVETPAFKALSKEEQEAISTQKLVADTRVTVISQEAVLELEENPLIKEYYKANIAYQGGKFDEAKALYLSFLENRDEMMSSHEGILMVEAARRCLKSIAMTKVDELYSRIYVTAKSAYEFTSWKKGHRDKHDYGTAKGFTRDEAQKILKTQRNVVDLVKEIVSADNDVLTFEDAYEIVMRMESDDYNSVLGRLNVKDVNKFRNEYGDWDKDGIAFYKSKFGTHHENEKGEIFWEEGREYPAALDAIRSSLSLESGNIDDLIAVGSACDEAGLYQAAEMYYDTAFRDLYGKYAVGPLENEAFILSIANDKDKMAEFSDKVTAYAKERGETLSVEEFLEVNDKFIKEAWFLAIRTKITNECIAGRVKGPIAKKWLDYNEKLLLTDRRFYQILRRTKKENAALTAFAVQEGFEWGLAFAAGLGVGAVASKALIKVAGTSLVMSGALRKTAFQLIKKYGIKKGLGLAARKLPFALAGVGAAAIVFPEARWKIHRIIAGQTEQLWQWEGTMQEIGQASLMYAFTGAAGSAGSLLKTAGWKGLLVKTPAVVGLDATAITASHVIWENSFGNGIAERDIAPIFLNSAIMSVVGRGTHATMSLAGKWVKAGGKYVGKKGMEYGKKAWDTAAEWNNKQRQMYPNDPFPPTFGKIWGMAKKNGPLNGLQAKAKAVQQFFTKPRFSDLPPATPNSPSIAISVPKGGPPSSAAPVMRAFEGVSPEVVIGAKTPLQGWTEAFGAEAGAKLRNAFNKIPAPLQEFVRVVPPQNLGDAPIIVLDQDLMRKKFDLDNIKDVDQMIAVYQQMGLIPPGDVEEIKKEMLAGMEKAAKEDPEFRAILISNGIDPNNLPEIKKAGLGGVALIGIVVFVAYRFVKRIPVLGSAIEGIWGGVKMAGKGLAGPVGKAAGKVKVWANTPGSGRFLTTPARKWGAIVGGSVLALTAAYFWLSDSDDDESDGGGISEVRRKQEEREKEMEEEKKKQEEEAEKARQEEEERQARLKALEDQNGTITDFEEAESRAKREAEEEEANEETEEEKTEKKKKTGRKREGLAPFPNSTD